jgi:flagellar motor component MotA
MKTEPELIAKLRELAEWMESNGILSIENEHVDTDRYEYVFDIAPILKDGSSNIES